MSTNHIGGLEALKQKMIRDTEIGIGEMLNGGVDSRAELERLLGASAHTTRRTRGATGDSGQSQPTL